MSTSDTAIGAVVRYSRESNLLSQQDLAKSMRDRGFKWSQATVWSVESGERALRYTEALELRELCGFDSGSKPDANEALRGVEMSIKALQELAEKLR